MRSEDCCKILSQFNQTVEVGIDGLDFIDQIPISVPIALEPFGKVIAARWAAAAGINEVVKKAAQ